MTPYAPGPLYPTVWERLLAFGRKNKPAGRKQEPRKVKGRAKPPHRGGKGGKGGGGKK